MKVFGWIVAVFFIIVIGGLVFVHFSPDYNMYIVRSDSMKPVINTGDTVVIGPQEGPFSEGVKAGDIVTYSHGGDFVTHRVLSVSGNTLQTKGDAAEDPDLKPVNLSNVIGVYLFRIRGIGYVQNFIRTRPGWLVVVIIPAAILVALLVREIRKRKKELPGVA